jgi:phenylpyruvate tautomerase PptA (4-oxalocrotonate tautomerase family)
VPYLRITCPELSELQRTQIAARLTDVINDLFYNPQARLTRAELRERTTIHFTPFREGELFIGGRTPQQRQAVDLTVELSDWNLSVRQQRKIASGLTPVLAEVFAVPSQDRDGINIRFHSYPPTDFAVGGRLLADIIPRVGQLAKKWLG